jgi:hypothetical protein
MLRNFILLVFLCCGFMASATIRVVNNNTPSPGQYTTIEAGIAAANDGDTLYITGSSLPYGTTTITISKRLIIIGTGHKSLNNNVNVSTINQDIQLGSKGADGCQLIGLDINGSIYPNADSIQYITIKRCKIAGQIRTAPWSAGQYTSAFSGRLRMWNWIIESCYLSRGYSDNWDACSVHLGYYSKVINFQVRNCVATGAIGGISTNNSPGSANIVISNNLIWPRTSEAWINFLEGGQLIVLNNILMQSGDNFGSGTFGAGNAGNGGSTWRNNIAFGSSNNTFANNGTNITGNISNTDPGFQGFTPNSSSVNNWDYGFDMTLASSSPCRNAGTDNTDIGPSGAIGIVFNKFGTPNIPQIRSLSFLSPATVAPGGSIQINVISTIKN